MWSMSSLLGSDTTVLVFEVYWCQFRLFRSAFLGYWKSLCPANSGLKICNVIDKTFGGKIVALSDMTLACSDCGSDFVFTVGEQEFHASRGFTNNPRRCTSCRNARRGQPRDGGGGGGGGGGGQREMFTVVCANCGNDATVPFRPSGDRPVYCSDCFNRMRN